MSDGSWFMKWRSPTELFEAASCALEPLRSRTVRREPPSWLKEAYCIARFGKLVAACAVKLNHSPEFDAFLRLGTEEFSVEITDAVGNRRPDKEIREHPAIREVDSAEMAMSELNLLPWIHSAFVRKREKASARKLAGKPYPKDCILLINARPLALYFPTRGRSRRQFFYHEIVPRFPDAGDVFSSVAVLVGDSVLWRRYSGCEVQYFEIDCRALEC